MKHFPLNQTLIIAFLLGCIFCVLKFLPLVPEASPHEPTPSESNQIDINSITAYPIFRFSSKPKKIKLMDAENNLIFETTTPEYEYEHEASNVKIPTSKEELSNLRLLVEWEEAPDPYHFFTMEFEGHPKAKFGIHTFTQDIAEEIILQW